MENSCDTKNNTAKSCKLDSRLPVLHPVVLGATETSISLDTESISLSSSDSESECTNDVVPSGGIDFGQVTGINVENSTDVVFGTRNHYHGPVTFNQTVIANTQNQNGFIENSKTDEDVQNSKDQLFDKDASFSTNQDLRSKKFKRAILWGVVLLSITLSATVGVVVFYKTNTSGQEPTPSDTTTTPSGNEHITTPAGFPHRMYTREVWGGTPPSYLPKALEHPTKYVVISHTAGPFCNSFKSCSELVRNIQAYHMGELDCPDIGYNFLIGNDGDVYIGRDWDIRNIHGENNIGISMIGNFVSRDIMTPDMISTLKDLLKLGVTSKKLAADYQLVCHNQTYLTESPGKNVCNVIAKFPNYFPGKVVLNWK